jgi:hypothetical protein
MVNKVIISNHLEILKKCIDIFCNCLYIENEFVRHIAGT